MSKIQDFNLSANLLEAILWQYNDAEKLISLVENDNDWYQENVINFLNQWYYDVFNVDTATEFGLSVWAKILDVNFATPPEDTRDTNVFGFGTYYNNFYVSNFSPVKDTTYQLSLSQKRLIIKLTYQKYNVFPSIPNVNKIIKNLIADAAYVIDNMDMSVTIVTNTTLDSGIEFILQNFNLLPIPAGVSYEIVETI